MFNMNLSNIINDRKITEKNSRVYIQNYLGQKKSELTTVALKIK